MNKLITLFLMLVATSSYAGGEMKEVCMDEVKKGKTVKVCKTIKVHKKLDGTKVPGK